MKLLLIARPSQLVRDTPLRRGFSCGRLSWAASSDNFELRQNAVPH
jgi:hypothetical protein